jgi:hypothetical protein
MKKIKLTKKLQLNKETIANLNSIVGGDVLTKNCPQPTASKTIDGTCPTVTRLTECITQGCQCSVQIECATIVC